MKVRNILSVAAVVIFCLLLLYKCNCRSPKTETSTSFINPPIKSADVPFQDYNIDASRGDTLLYPSGSILLFPPNAFVDKAGNVVNGNVQVKYREFSTPIDFFLSGIPMQYDSAGISYTFESSGMCDVRAFKDGVPVFVNPKNKPEINLVTDNDNVAQNLYYLDTTNQKWCNKGKSNIMDLGKSKTTVISPDLFDNNVREIIKPVKPSKVEGDMPIIKVVIDPLSFKELMAYDNLKFQLDKKENHFNPADAKVEWSDFKLSKGDRSGLYKINFINKNKSVVYNARPVLEEKDYDKAIKVFDNQMAVYKSDIAKAKSRAKINKEQHVKDSINDAEIERDNVKIARVNKITEAKNKIVDEKNKSIIKHNNDIISKQLVRNFEIDGFGIWNCDHPEYQNPIGIYATFKNTNGDFISLTGITMFYEGFNGILSVKNNTILVSRKFRNMFVGVVDQHFGYVNYEEFAKIKISAGQEKQTFTVTVVSDKDNNYDYIKRLVAN